MKILHLTNHCHRIGNGIMNVAVDLACEQAKGGHDVRFASAGGSFVSLLTEFGVAHDKIAQYWREPAAVLRGIIRLRGLIAAFKPDVVHAHMMGGALMARALNTPRKFALVTSVHNEWQRTSNLMGVGDKVIAVSEATRAAMQARGLTKAKLRTVRNGPIRSPRATLPSSKAVRLEKPALLTVCGLYRRKGVAELIEAFATIADKHRAARLYVVGDGPDRALFQAMAQASPFNDRINFVGFIENPAPLFDQADIFVLASHSEPFGLVFAEAREAGCAIIGTRVGGVPEVLEQGAAGMLIPPHDVAALASALDRLLEDDVLRASYRRRALQNLDWLSGSRMAAETLAVYRECLESAVVAAAPGQRFLSRLP